MNPTRADSATSRLTNDTRLECKICWYLYDPAEGDAMEQVEPGTPFSELLEMAGRMRDGRPCKAVIPGGSSAPVIPGEAMMDLTMDYDSIAQAGSMLGSGAVMVMDSTTDIPAAALTLVKFYAHESCGKCVPCREGGTWLYRLVQRIVDGHGTDADLQTILDVGESICPGDMPHAASERLGLDAVPFPYKMTTICFVGPSAYAPIHSALTLFPEEFEALVTTRQVRTSIPVTAAPGGGG